MTQDATTIVLHMSQRLNLQEQEINTTTKHGHHGNKNHMAELDVQATTCMEKIIYLSKNAIDIMYR